MATQKNGLTTVLITAYAVNPYKGSEDAMGWNFILQAARHHRVVAITRRNNAPAIRKYFGEHPELRDLESRISFLHYDWAKWMLFWKKGPLLSLIYFYAWQRAIPGWFQKQGIEVDIVHNLNFHNDWTPSFLWKLDKPFVWGPVGHHPLIPAEYIKQFGTNAWAKDRFLWALKNIFWKADPALKKCRQAADHILCMHGEAAEKLRLTDRWSVMPSVAAEPVDRIADNRAGFNVLSVGRFVPLKGFDVALSAFGAFYYRQSIAARRSITLTLVGKGPEQEALRDQASKLNILHAVRFIPWMSREALEEVYCNASVFLYPSHEGAGMVVAEAMRYGLPVLCWDNCGPGELVHPQSELRHKYKSYEKSVTEYAATLERLYKDHDLYEQERRLALERFDNDLQWDVRGDQLKAIYKRVLGEPEEADAIASGHRRLATA